MNNFDARTLAERYKVSWYVDIDRIPEERVTDGRNVPVARGEDLLVCLRENVDEARFNRDGVRKRYERAQQDGLFDIEALKATPDKKLREEWIAAIDTMKGDKARCVAELRHWRGYLALAMAGKLPPLKREGTAAELIMGLADAKSLPPVDRRLPPEREEEEVAF